MEIADLAMEATQAATNVLKTRGISLDDPEFSSINTAIYEAIEETQDRSGN